MKQLEVFHQFGKGALQKIARTNNCVIYTRVSTKEQADTNMSLATQRKACGLLAQKNGYIILGEFGGTYESAKNDERKEFNRMLQFLKKSTERISYIIVYSVDRFSRSGANAIYIKEQLLKQGIHIIAVTQPTDSETASGSLQQNIQFIFSEYDNQVRREKCIAGTREALLRGEWVQNTPLGYDSVRVNGKRILTIIKMVELLKKAFEWKAQGCSSEEVRARLEKLGLKVPNQTLSDILHNPFYCGLMSHNTLEGKVVQGTHPAVISKELFLQVHGIMQQKKQNGYAVKFENEYAPLKNFLKCDTCGRNTPAYIVKVRNLWYYKCRTKGCNNNKSAKQLNDLFAEILRYFSVEDEEVHALIKEQLTALYYKYNAENETAKAAYKRQLTELQTKLDRLEERYVTEEINADLYQKYQAKFREEKLKIEQELQSSLLGVSNIELAIENAIAKARNLSVYWGSAGYYEKTQLQKLVFPEGIRYNKKLNKCRTSEIDYVMLWIALFMQDTANKKIGIPELNLKYSDLVPSAGVEPACQ